MEGTNFLWYDINRYIAKYKIINVKVVENIDGKQKQINFVVLGNYLNKKGKTHINKKQMCVFIYFLREKSI